MTTMTTVAERGTNGAEQGTALAPQSDEQRAARPMAQIAAGRRGLQLATLDDYWRFAQCVVKSGLAPKGMERPESVMIAVQFGAEVGLTPMMAIQNIAVINGRPAMWGDALLALARSSEVWDESGFREWFTGTYPRDDFTAHCSCQRRGAKEAIERTFSVEDAKLAKLWGKTGRDGQPTPWVQYPKRMLQMRARSFALRDGFTDVMRGMIAVEEAQDIPTVSSEVVASRPVLGAEGVLSRMQAQQTGPEPQRVEVPAQPDQQEQPAEPAPADVPAVRDSDLPSVSTIRTLTVGECLAAAYGHVTSLAAGADFADVSAEGSDGAIVRLRCSAVSGGVKAGEFVVFDRIACHQSRNSKLYTAESVRLAAQS